MNFFRTLFALCSGTSVFPRLLSSVSLTRAFFHLFLLLILCTVSVTLSTWLFERQDVSRLCERFFEKTGSFLLTEDRIIPEKEQNRSRGYKLTDALRFDYFASGSDFTPDYLKNKHAQCGFLCFQTGVAFWAIDFQDPDSDMFRMAVLPAGVLYSAFTQGNISTDFIQKISRSKEELYTEKTMYDTVKKELLSTPPKEKDPKQDTLHPYRLRESFAAGQTLLLLVMLSLFMYLTEAVLLLILSIACFSLAEMFRASGMPKKIPYKTILTATIYASFPALVIATLFHVFQLKILSFQLTFFCVFFLYQIFAFNSVFEFFNPRKTESNSNDDDF